MCPGFYTLKKIVNFEFMQALLLVFSSLALASAAMVLRARNPVHAVLYLVLTFCQAAGLLVLLGLDFFAMLFLIVYVGAIAVLFLFVIMMLNVKVTEIHDNTSRFLPFAGILGVLFFGQLFLIFAAEFPALEYTSLSNEPASLIDRNKGLLRSFPFEFMCRGLSQWCFGELTWGQLQADWFQCMQEIQQLHTLAVPSDQLSAASAHTSKALVFPEYKDWMTTLHSLSSVQAIGTVLYTDYILFFLLASLILLVAMIGAIMLTLHKGSSVKRQIVSEQNAREPTKTIYKVS